MQLAGCEIDRGKRGSEVTKICSAIEYKIINSQHTIPAVILSLVTSFLFRNFSELIRETMKLSRIESGFTAI